LAGGTSAGSSAWRENNADNIKQADQNWSNVKNQAEPVIVGPPCRDHPPTVIVTADGGARRVIVGAQSALDKDGNVVGKGDMRAQIEQVGKNVEACLKAAGATASDILLTRTYVADIAAFSKNAEIRALSRLGTAGQHDGRSAKAIAKAGGVRFPCRDRGGGGGQLSEV
jgi:enamine deaminase RidA (YjgF/YER057c/UK114 family)